jgi:hypothetical protein
MSSSVEAVRITCLPRELNDELQIADYLAELLGAVQLTVKIVHNKTDTGIPYRSAFVDIGAWTEGEYMDNMQKQLVDAGNNGLEFSEIVTFDGRRIPLNFHFPNGKPMPYIKILASEKNTYYDTKPLALDEGAWTSLYVPVVPADLVIPGDWQRADMRERLTQFFECQLRVGKVSRVDLMSRTKPEDDKETKMLCAYIHFDHWYDNSATTILRGNIETTGEFRCNGFYDGIKFTKFENRRFITIKINHKPLPEVKDPELNIHQLAAANEKLTARVAELEALLSTTQTLTEPITAQTTDSAINFDGLQRNAALVKENKALQQELAALKKRNEELEQASA